MLAFAITRVPQYSATASVLIDPDNERMFDLQAALQNRPLNEAIIESEIGVLTSSTVLRQVISDLGIAKDPEFVPGLVPFSSRPLSVQVNDTIRSFVRTMKEFYNRLTRDDQALRARIDGIPNAAAPDWRVALVTLSRSVRARQVGTSYVIAVDVETRSPVKSAEIANSIVDHYITFSRQSKREAASSATQWMNAEIVKAAAQVKQSSDAVDAFRVKMGLTTRDQIETASLQLERLRQSAEEARRAYEAIQAGTARQVSTTTTGSIGDDATPTLTATQERSVALQRRMQTLNDSLVDAETRLTELTSAWGTYGQLERQALAAQRLYERLLEQIKTVTTLENSQQADARVVSAALPPLNPSDPSARLLMAMAMAFGAGFGVVIVGGRELLRRSFHSRDEIETFTGFPVGAAMPLMPESSDRRSLIKAVQEQPNSELAESLRKLRSLVMRGKALNDERVVMVTSSLPGEGKSSVAFMLAWSLLKANAKAVVLNLDLRRPALADEGDALVPGQADAALPRHGAPDTPLSQRSMLGIPVLSFDGAGEQASDFLASADLKTVIARLRAAYDFVVIDTPPLGPTSDVSAFSSLVDGALFVIDWKRTSRPIIADGLQALERLDVKVIGTVLTKVDTKVEAQYRSLPYDLYSSYVQQPASDR